MPLQPGYSHGGLNKVASLFIIWQIETNKCVKRYQEQIKTLTVQMEFKQFFLKIANLLAISFNRFNKVYMSLL